METTNIFEEYNKLSNKIALKQQRNLKLCETDRYMLCDYPITPENLEIVKTYRQALRDFTNNDYIFPEKPSFIITMN